MSSIRVSACSALEQEGGCGSAGACCAVEIRSRRKRQALSLRRRWGLTCRGRPPGRPGGESLRRRKRGANSQLGTNSPHVVEGMQRGPAGASRTPPPTKAPSLACCLPLPASGRGAAKRRRGAACPGVVPLSVPSGQLSPAFRRGEPSGFALILPASHPPRLSVGAGVLDGPLSPPPPGKAPRCAHRAEGGSPRPCGGTQRHSCLQPVVFPQIGVVFT